MCKSAGIRVSGFVDKHNGLLALTNEEYECRGNYCGWTLANFCAIIACGRAFPFTHERNSHSSVSLSGSQTSGKKAKHEVGVEKWQREIDHEHQSLLWLRCQKDAANRSLVATLYCEVC